MQADVFCHFPTHTVEFDDSFSVLLSKTEACYCHVDRGGLHLPFSS